jgi:hypothetical protein
MAWSPRHEQLFISFSRDHEDDIKRLVDALTAAANVVFFDTRSLRFGDNWRGKVEDAIKASRKFFLFWCSHSLSSGPIDFELTIVLRNKTPVVPFMLADTPLPASIEDLHAVTSTKGICFQLEHEVKDPRGADDPPLPCDPDGVGIDRMFGERAGGASAPDHLDNSFEQNTLAYHKGGARTRNRHRKEANTRP